MLTLGAMATCGWLAAWQWQRAGSAMGSALNIGYGLQWPVFAVFFGYMWWRFLRMEVAKLAGESAVGPGAGRAGSAGSDPVESRAAEPHGTGPRTARPRAATAPDGPSPFGPRPRSAVPVAVDDDPELAAYNRMLAELAARHPED